MQTNKNNVMHVCFYLQIEMNGNQGEHGQDRIADLEDSTFKERDD